MGMGFGNPPKNGGAQVAETARRTAAAGSPDLSAVP